MPQAKKEKQESPGSEGKAVVDDLREERERVAQGIRFVLADKEWHLLEEIALKVGGRLIPPKWAARLATTRSRDRESKIESGRRAIVSAEIRKMKDLGIKGSGRNQWVRLSPITTVWFEGQPRSATDLARVDITELYKLDLRDSKELRGIKRGRPPVRERLKRYQTWLGESWGTRRIAREEAGPGATADEIRAAYKRAYSFIKSHNLKPRSAPAKPSPVR
jgi:hypothetical protein